MTIRQGTDSEREGPSESSLEDPSQDPQIQETVQGTLAEPSEPQSAQKEAEGNVVTEQVVAGTKRELFHAARSSSKAVEASVEYVENTQGDNSPISSLPV